MTIYRIRRVTRRPATAEARIGNALWRACMGHFTQYLGVRNIGLSYESCNAAVAVSSDTPFYESCKAPPYTFRLVYGNSRVYRGLDLGVPIRKDRLKAPFSSSLLEEHAEQVAIRTAENAGADFFEDANGYGHIYVDLEPCDNCEPWLDDHDEIWYVHYFRSLRTEDKLKLKLGKRRMRKREFGTYEEPRKKKQKPN